MRPGIRLHAPSSLRSVILRKPSMGNYRRGMAAKGRNGSGGAQVVLTILSVAYPLAPVGPAAVGGAEQVLAALDRALIQSGDRSIVISSAESSVRGIHIPIRCAQPPFDKRGAEQAQRSVQRAISSVLSSQRIDLVHLHGIDFASYLPAEDIPVLVTLHMPFDWYPVDPSRIQRRDLYFNFVSESQKKRARTNGDFPVIENGVTLPATTVETGTRRFAVSMGRICPEKNFHVAMDAASDAGTSFVLAGAVFPYDAHIRYFDEKILPRLGARCRFVGALGAPRKQRLLASARCLVAPSLVQETSSLVAMEALSVGTPVVALASGALPEIVDHGRTGFIVGDQREMAHAIRNCDRIDPDICRASAARRFSESRMVQEYSQLYRTILRWTSIKSKQQTA
jgi:glycosyltransferase involved in cell wall biosynthesis